MLRINDVMSRKFFFFSCPTLINDLAMGFPLMDLSGSLGFSSMLIGISSAAAVLSFSDGYRGVIPSLTPLSYFIKFCDFTGIVNRTAGSIT
jgi:hypothetical protein